MSTLIGLFQPPPFAQWPGVIRETSFKTSITSKYQILQTGIQGNVPTSCLADAEDEGDWVEVKPRLAICEDNFMDCKDSRNR